MAADLNIPPGEDRDPVPGIPATDGWKQMKFLLDKALPIQEPIPSTLLPKRKAVWYISIISGLLLTAALFYFMDRNRHPIDKYRNHKTSSPIRSNIEKAATNVIPGRNEPLDTTGSVKDQTGTEVKDSALVLMADKTNKITGAHTSAHKLRKYKEARAEKAPIDRTAITRQVSPTGRKLQNTSTYPINLNTSKEKRILSKDSENFQWPVEKVQLVLPTDTMQSSDTELSSYRSFVAATIAVEESISDHLLSTNTNLLSETANNLATYLADSIANSRNKKAKQIPEKIVKGGLQLLGAIPLTAPTYYFSGASGKTEIYRLLAPSFWMSYSRGKSIFSFSLVPFLQNNLPDVPFRQLFRGPVPNALSDTTLTLLKYFGAGGTVSYGRTIRRQLQLSAGIEIAAWSKALIKWQRSGPNAAGIPYAIKKDTLYAISSGDTLWKYANGLQLSAIAEIVYQKSRWQAGFKAGFPLKKPVNADRAGYPLQLSLFYRYTFFRKTR